MSRAAIATRLWRLSPTLRRVRDTVRPFAEQTGDRAFMFHQFGDGSVVEVRVWPGGDTRVTRK